MTPNLKVLQSVCIWNGLPRMGCLKMGVDESLVFNSQKAYFGGSSQMNS